MLGIVNTEEALQQASDKILDLVEISPGIEFPVCKILDFSRYRYDAKKKQQESRKKQKKVLLKEIKFKVNIGQNDFDVKTKKIIYFLKNKDKVKASLWFKGREIIHSSRGHELFQKIIKSVGPNAKIESEPKIEGKQITMILSPNIS